MAGMTLTQVAPSHSDRYGPFRCCGLMLLMAILAFPVLASPVLADGMTDPNTLPIPLPAIPRTADCDAYARAYADSYLGNGDPTGDMVANGMEGAVVGGAWAGRSGARRGAVAGGAVAVLDNLAAYPGGWQGLYDMAYQMCRNETSGANYRPQTQGSPSAGSGCRSRAIVNDPNHNMMHAGSRRPGC